jgi:ABC-type antimicrobial peptide transport system permease subunit
MLEALAFGLATVLKICSCNNNATYQEKEWNVTSEWKEIWVNYRQNKLAVVGLIVVCSLLAIATAGPSLS